MTRPNVGAQWRHLKESDEYFCRISNKKPFSTAREIYEEAGGPPMLSISTVQRYLRKSGLFGRISTKKPLLTKTNIKKRISWCKAYTNFKVSDWKDVVFSDEVRIEMHSKRRRFVRRRIGESLKFRFVTKTVKYGGFHILLWGAIKGDGTRILVQCPNRINSTIYQDVLSNGLFQVYNSSNIFMQNYAPCHKLRSTIQFLEDNNVCMMDDWPPQSPDLNVIENLWSILKQEVLKEHPKSAADLWLVAQRKWYAISNDVITNLYQSIPRRLSAVLEAKGLYTKY